MFLTGRDLLGTPEARILDRPQHNEKPRPLGEVAAKPTERAQLCAKNPLTRYRGSVSLRLGHARALTPYYGVIHYPRAASLPKGRAFGCVRATLGV